MENTVIKDLITFMCGYFYTIIFLLVFMFACSAVIMHIHKNEMIAELNKLKQQYDEILKNEHREYKPMPEVYNSIKQESQKYGK